MTPVMPILIGAPNEQCRNPEVAAVFSMLKVKCLTLRDIAGGSSRIEIHTLYESY